MTEVAVEDMGVICMENGVNRRTRDSAVAAGFFLFPLDAPYVILTWGTGHGPFPTLFQ
jgi:hypothetical protein